MMNHRLPAWTFVLVLALIPACGGDGSSGGTPPPPPPGEDTSVTVTDPVGTQGGFVSIAYTLVDGNGEALTIAAEYSVNGGTTYATATMAAGGHGVAGLASAPTPGVGHIFMWNSIADGVALVAADTDVRFRITPSDASAAPADESANYTVDNATNTAPVAAITAPAGGSSPNGLVFVEYTLSDDQGSLCLLSAVEYSINSGGTWLPATKGPGGDGVSGLTSAPGAGIAHRFVWHSVVDGVAGMSAVTTVRFRITPTDGASGSAAMNPGGDFTVYNATNTSGASVGPYYPHTFDPQVPSADSLNAVAADAKHLYLAGDSDNGNVWRIQARRLEDRALVWNKSSDPSTGGDRVTDIATDGAYVYVAGKLTVGPDNFAWHVEKREAATGDLVAAFGTAGSVTSVALGDTNGARIRIDGAYLYVIGPDETLAPGSFNFQTRIEKRLLSDGSLVTAFDGDGVLQSNVNANPDGALILAINGTHLFLVGVQDIFAVADSSIRYEKRLLTDGSLVSGFGTGGVVVDPNGTGTDMPLAMDVSNDNMFVLVQRESAAGSGVFEWYIEKRSLATGVIVTSVMASRTYDDMRNVGAVIKRNTELFICGIDASQADSRWRIEKRSAINLALDTTFDGDGVKLVDLDPSGVDECATDMVLVDGVLYVVGNSPSGDPAWRIEALWP